MSVPVFRIPFVTLIAAIFAMKMTGFDEDLDNTMKLRFTKNLFIVFIVRDVLIFAH